MTDYRPIDCGQYSEYELAILQRKRLRVSWHEFDGQSHIELLTPIDLRTRDHEEFLVVKRPDGRAFELRLDYIVRVEEL
jgi:Rho-binding antiterminator